MAGNDLPHEGEADAIAFELFLAMQTLEYLEQLVGVFHIEARAVIPNKEYGSPGFLFMAHFNDRRVPLPRVFQGVGEQVDPDLLDQGRIPLAGRQFTDLQLDSGRLLTRVQQLEGLLHQGHSINFLAMQR